MVNANSGWDPTSITCSPNALLDGCKTTFFGPASGRTSQTTSFASLQAVVLINQSRLFQDGCTWGMQGRSLSKSSPTNSPRVEVESSLRYPGSMDYVCLHNRINEQFTRKINIIRIIVLREMSIRTNNATTFKSKFSAKME